MTSKEVQDLTNALMQLAQAAEFDGSKDPFKAYWNGFDAAIELAFHAIREFIKENDVEIIQNQKTIRDITCSNYERSQKRTQEKINAWMKGR